MIALSLIITAGIVICLAILRAASWTPPQRPTTNARTKWTRKERRKLRRQGRKG